jgi:hypothetical protein
MTSKSKGFLGFLLTFLEDCETSGKSFRDGCVIEWSGVCEVWELWGSEADVRYEFIEEMIGKIED